jgi:hypothetical protein
VGFGVPSGFDAAVGATLRVPARRPALSQEAAMPRSNRICALFPAAALLLGLAGGAATGATEHTQFVTVWVADSASPRSARAPALLNVPSGWGVGDAAAVLAPGGEWPVGQRDRLVAALLESGAAVLELSPLPVAEQPGAVARDMLAALRLLREIEGVGLVVAIGFGAGGDGALAAQRLMPDEGFAAAVRLGPGAPRFAIGAVPEAEAWPVRAPLFCHLLAGLEPASMDFAAACQGGLLPHR